MFEIATRNPLFTSKAKRAGTQRESCWQHFNAGFQSPSFFHTVPNQRFSNGCSKQKGFVLAAQATVSLYQGPKTTRKYDLEEVWPVHVDACGYMCIHVNTCGSIVVNQIQWALSMEDFPRSFPTASSIQSWGDSNAWEYGLGLQAAQTFLMDPYGGYCSMGGNWRSLGKNL